MKTIDTLVEDIQGLFGEAQKGRGHTFDLDVLASFGTSIATHMANAVAARTWKRPPNTLRMSEAGKPCIRQLWYQVNEPSKAEEMQSHTLFKFVYGNMIEEATLLLAEAAGHKVELRQHEVELNVNGWRVVGHLDAVIDGVLVDVKSCSPFGYKKFKEGLTPANDSFGYITQLSGYNLGLSSIGRRQGFLAVDKQNGHVGYFDSAYDKHVEHRLKATVLLMSASIKDIPRTYKLEPEGTSGNMKLPMECSYCPFKHECWKDANDGEGLRTFWYSHGPVYLAVVKKEPKVLEIKPATSLGTPT
ncbi:PD-(D/E)XK nuclease superfamily [uncultured Caudovirales phage]|uniref:PD-(D/E)XK nuclease superfamily n=1 Tax=uncultured Caudovirales phage TaxID=2100421 RepID=A0A6J5QJ42_9CAUD|nr:PD-(D/E)XK nuclease superfamily [uncultured Caudovirales phage]CAB4182446.1 PD-(D/E)XK nuclease superfamily [uncultured Caudovirales phage]CAB4197814.1 PD-(D/E)XK nuclease superfamily [uncultured Caudovirales phage]CAB4212518.1 PD-(D/E)XK nuclease superfamily [uncultured Caudovirales phage]CAB5227161.1 PD-(D/E)XK nuclease superfamily [uncultured Caudovirales phage]